MTKLNARLFDEIVTRLTEVVPVSVRTASADIEANFRSILQTMLSKLDLVTREEFDIQANVLLRTREKLELLENKIKILEDEICNKNG
ncbi:MAG: Ubiquinone biosynthesis accessory factor UbiK [Legionellaceae bacterium]